MSESTSSDPDAQPSWRGTSMFGHDKLNAIRNNSAAFRRLMLTVVWFGRRPENEPEASSAATDDFFNLYNEDSSGFGSRMKLSGLRTDFECAMREGIKKRIEIENSGVGQTAVEYDERNYYGLKMLRSYVSSLPTGNEKGIYYCVDVGGTNLRVMKVNLSNIRNKREDATAVKDGKWRDSFQNCVLAMDETEFPSSKVKGTIAELFEFIADRILQFITVVKQETMIFSLLSHSFQERHHNNNDESQSCAVSFTFSYPTEQTAINSGKLIQWNKGFNCIDGIGVDVLLLLQQSCDKLLELRRGSGTDGHQYTINVLCLVNDTIATLAAASFLDNETSVAVIAGTGTNAAYIMRQNNEDESGLIKGEKMINIEWGNFGSKRLINYCDEGNSALENNFYLDADYCVQQNSQNPGAQYLEKMTSGLYLGEISHRIIMQILKELSLSEYVKADGAFMTTPEMSKIDNPDAWHGETLNMERAILKTVFGLQEENNVTCHIVFVIRQVCKLVRMRAAQLLGSVLAAVLSVAEPPWSHCERKSSRRIGVAVDGGLYENYEFFRGDFLRALEEIYKDDEEGPTCNQKTTLDVQLVSDGSAFGAAVIAALCSNHLLDGGLSG